MFVCTCIPILFFHRHLLKSLSWRITLVWHILKQASVTNSKAVYHLYFLCKLHSTNYLNIIQCQDPVPQKIISGIYHLGLTQTSIHSFLFLAWMQSFRIWYKALFLISPVINQMTIIEDRFVMKYHPVHLPCDISSFSW